MTDLYCPVCRKDSFIDPQLKIYISPCYHKLCSTCINRIFKVDAPCPQCGLILKKMNFFIQNFEDIQIERECRIRKMINYKELEDFDNEDEYNDYLEKMENFIEELMLLKKNEEIIKKIKELPVDRKIKVESFNPIENINIIDFRCVYENDFGILGIPNDYRKCIFIKKAVYSLNDNDI